MKQITKYNVKGFTLIELLIVVAIIGILAAIAIPGYIGLQERSRKGAIIRVANVEEAVIQSWLLSAKKSGTTQGTLREVDYNNDGKVDASDVTNNELADLNGGSLVTTFTSSRSNDMSPWGGPLWGTTAGGAARQITLEQNGSGANISSITMSVKDYRGTLLFTKKISAD